ncbi:tyrosine-type recombinase/integrase [Crossiella sp. CA198]|uniref:tyrosine-type recombinase/integrase n=1 Tax=Crossiella sp. CA198 TaxID=3455607 RepID=UPI003F8D3391
MNATTSTASAPSTVELEAARVLLERLGIKPEDLLSVPKPRPPMPTFAKYIPEVSDAVREGTRRVYGTYWNRICAEWGDRHLDEPTALEIERFAEDIRTAVRVRSNARGGRGAVEHFIAAMRCLYRHAEKDKLISAADNPALKVDKPRRLPSTRCAIASNRLAEVNQVAATTGDDPELDTLILRLHTETACRRGGALALRLRDLDPQQCLIMLREKGGTVRWQPVSRTLMCGLLALAKARGAGPDDQVLRYRNGKPITSRRYDHLWQRIAKHLPWAAAQQITTHWLRHTTLTWVERNFGYGVARAFAGHNDQGGDTGSTTTYVRADLQEIARALAALTDEPHPLA